MIRYFRNTGALHLAFFLACCGGALLAPALQAGKIGDNQPFAGITATLRKGEVAKEVEADWNAYVRVSDKRRALDIEQFVQTAVTNGIKTVTVRPKARSSGLRIERDAVWFRGEEARKTADGLVSFQTTSGGWSKHLDFSRPREKQEFFGAVDRAEGAEFPLQDAEKWWEFVPTFDNEGTTKPMRYLARFLSARTDVGDKYMQSFSRGLDFIVEAQMPCGGWPQVYPLAGGYHDAITLNDSASINVMALLLAISRGEGDYQFVPAHLRQKAGATLSRGIANLNAIAIKLSDDEVAWCQQFDPFSLSPCGARSFEMPAYCPVESAAAVSLLMQIESPDFETARNVVGCMKWLKRTHRPLGGDPTTGWPRFIDIKTGMPIFGDRNGGIFDTVEDISAERRKSYDWFSTAPSRAFDLFAAWPYRGFRSSRRPESYFAEQFEAVRNSDVGWQQAGSAVVPKLNTYAEQLFSVLEREAASGRRGEILAAAQYYLGDPTRYVLAHIVLTYHSGMGFESTGQVWNMLNVDEILQSDRDQRLKLAIFWSKRLFPN